MKEVCAKQLTNNQFVNKCLLMNPTHLTKFRYCKVYRRFIKILYFEHRNGQLSNEEIRYIIHEILRLQTNLHNVSGKDKVLLIEMNCCIDELKDSQNSSLRALIAKKGHHLQDYVNDSNRKVRRAAERQLKKQCSTHL